MTAKQSALFPDPIRLLLVEDNRDDHALLTDLLDAVADMRFTVDWAKSLEAAQDRLENGQFDACLIDQALPDGEGLKLLEAAAIRGFPAPMIVLADQGCPHLDRRAMALGALGFLDKTRLDPTLLERTIRYAVQQQNTLRKLAHNHLLDEETGLIRSPMFRDRLGRALAFAKRRQSQVAVVLIEIDQMGESLAIQARRLTQHLRKTDTIARLSDRQLALVLEEIKSADDAALVARKVLDKLTMPIPSKSGQVSPNPSIGIALYPEDCGDIDSLLRQAEAAMRRAGAEGGRRYRFGSGRLNGQTQRDVLLSSDLTKALDEGALTLRYRPLVHVAQTAISLVAEIHAKGALKRRMPPSQFLSIANDRPLIERTMDWILSTALSQLSTWRRQGFEQIGLSLPFISTRAQDIPILEQAIRRQLDQASVAPDQIELDLDPDLVISDLAGGGHRLESLKSTGVRLALDGFGRDETSVHHLTSDLINSLKLSPKLYRDLPGNVARETLLKAIITLGHDLDLKVVANGASDDRQFAFLRQAGCDAIKLQATGSSLTADMFTNWMRQRTGAVPSGKMKILAKPPMATTIKPADPGMMAFGTKEPISSLDTH